MTRRIRRWFVEAQFTRRDAVTSSALAVALVASLVGKVTGEHWLYAVTWAIFIALWAVGLWYGVKLIGLLVRRRRERAAARSRFEQRREGLR